MKGQIKAFWRIATRYEKIDGNFCIMFQLRVDSANAIR
jgi:hypothetical protein